jgi:hypothetical protein
VFRHGRIRHLMPPPCRRGGVPVHHDPVDGICTNPGNREWGPPPLSFYSSSSIRTSGLRPWMFESTLHTRGVWKGEIGQIKNKMYRTRYHTVLLYMYYCTATVLLCLLFVHIHHLQQYHLSHGPHQRSSVPQILDLGSLCFQQLCKYADLL